MKIDMKQLCIGVFLLLLSVKMYGHEPNEAYFVITQEASIVQVQAEFPWTIRKALLNDDVSLKKATSKEEFDKAFFNYIKKNLILKGISGQSFDLLSVEELPKTGHNHGSTFLISFSGSELMSVKNELMFNLYENQQNYHEFNMGEKNIQEYSTTKKEPYFVVRVTPENNFLWLGMGLIFLIVVFSIVKKAT